MRAIGRKKIWNRWFSQDWPRKMDLSVIGMVPTAICGESRIVGKRIPIFTLGVSLPVSVLNMPMPSRFGQDNLPGIVVCRYVPGVILSVPLCKKVRKCWRLGPVVSVSTLSPVKTPC
jgi:hypothetical protein